MKCQVNRLHLREQPRVGGGVLGEGPRHLQEARHVSEAEVLVHRLLGQQSPRPEHDGEPGSETEVSSLL